jgi:hypothetical protein
LTNLLCDDFSWHLVLMINILVGQPCLDFVICKKFTKKEINLPARRIFLE